MLDLANKLTSKEYAQKQLGNLDLSHLDKERDVARDIYDTSSQGLTTRYNELLDQINRNRQDYRTNFNIGRGTIAENAFDQNRLNKLDVGSRIVGKSGLKELGEIGNRIETGRQYSDLANTFYGDMDTLARTEKQGQSQYDLDKQSISNTLNQALSGIDTRGAEAENQWARDLASLAESVQGRWDSNTNAAKALAQAKSAAAQAHADNMSALSEQIKQNNKSSLSGILTGIATTTTNSKGKVVPLSQKEIDNNVNRALGNILTLFPNVDRNTAVAVLQEAGFAVPGVNASYNNPNISYYKQLIGG